jgi:hypothetical protein
VPENQRIRVEEKAAAVDSPKLEEMMRRKWMSLDAKVMALLRDGPESFISTVPERILREHTGSVFLNYCPACGALARTSQAQHCPKCFHDWHNEA